MEVRGPDLHLIQELDPRDRNARLDGDDHGLAGGPDRWEWTHARRDRLWDAVQLQGDLGDDAERALRADEETREVVAGRAFSRPPRGADDVAVWEDDG